ncbi:hypothetical protein VNO78_06430 [Psophocarpus tetragonolobus]|uniref:Uncharacterized protein n=1 Tax=Psophocarpus tetragonolobus TaxID=3891 RepID=A0AAN9XS80_PSOTE
MRGEHGSKLFSAAEKAGMMSEGYGWLVTQGLSVELDPYSSAPKRMDNMQVWPLAMAVENATIHKHSRQSDQRLSPLIDRERNAGYEIQRAFWVF